MTKCNILSTKAVNLVLSFPSRWRIADTCLLYTSAGILRTPLPFGFGVTSRDRCQAPQLPNGYQPGCLRLLRLSIIQRSPLSSVWMSAWVSFTTSAWLRPVKAQKTGTQFRVKLLPVAEMLYEHYKDMHLSGDRVFPLKEMCIRDSRRVASGPQKAAYSDGRILR